MLSEMYYNSKTNEALSEVITSHDCTKIISRLNA